MDINQEQLGRSQDKIREAAQLIAEVSNHFAGKGDWGTQRMQYLAEAMVELNHAWSLVRAATNDTPTHVGVTRTAPEKLSSQAVQVPLPRVTVWSNGEKPPREIQAAFDRQSALVRKQNRRKSKR